jgi:hypothetical protein
MGGRRAARREIDRRAASGAPTIIASKRPSDAYFFRQSRYAWTARSSCWSSDVLAEPLTDPEP